MCPWCKTHKNSNKSRETCRCSARIHRPTLLLTLLHICSYFYEFWHSSRPTWTTTPNSIYVDIYTYISPTSHPSLYLTVSMTLSLSLSLSLCLYIYKYAYIYIHIYSHTYIRCSLSPSIYIYINIYVHIHIPVYSTAQ